MMESRVMTDFSAVVERSGEAGKQARYRRQRERRQRSTGARRHHMPPFCACREHEGEFVGVRRDPSNSSCVVLSCFVVSGVKADCTFTTKRADMERGKSGAAGC